MQSQEKSDIIIFVAFYFEKLKIIQKGAAFMNIKLSAIENNIDKIDLEMAKLFAQRMELVKDIASYKCENGIPVNDPEYDNRILENSAGYLDDTQLKEYYVRFMKHVLSISRSYQSRIQNGMKIAYSGIEGAFAHIAATRIFPNASHISYGDFEEAYKAVEDGICDSAVLPIENSFAGEVGQVMDLIFSGSLYINGVFELPIIQNLLGTQYATVADITDVVSHPQALSQCASYIKAHHFNQTEYANTALAAQHVASQNDRHIAAIASAETAELYGLKIIERNINSARSNTTRFAIFSRAPQGIEAKKKFILVFTVKNEPGALAKSVNIIAKHGFNMQSLRSRSMRSLAWQYYFYIEGDGNPYTPEGEAMLKELSDCCDKLKIAGSFDETHSI